VPDRRPAGSADAAARSRVWVGECPCHIYNSTVIYSQPPSPGSATAHAHPPPRQRNVVGPVSRGWPQWPEDARIAPPPRPARLRPPHSRYSVKTPQGLQALIDDGVIDEVLRPLKSGKE